MIRYPSSYLLKNETQTIGNKMTVLDKIEKYEDGKMTDEQETIEFFQSIIWSGLVWRLQGHYHRTAIGLLKAGLCTLYKKV